MDRLPKKINNTALPREIRWNGITEDMEYEEERKIIEQNNIEYTKKQYEKMGITIVEEYDDFFWSIILPEGWEIKATNHCMWKNLIDDKGRKRAKFFYKSSFYDRDAFTNFCTRYHAYVDHVADIGETYDIWKNSDYQGIVKDEEKVVFSTERVAVTGSYKEDDNLKAILQKKLDKYMAENYPNYKDIHAYWD